MGNALKLDTSSLQLVMEQEAIELLKWWQVHMLDTENGGFYGRRTVDNQLVPKAPKSIILNTRILWAFSAAARFFKKEAYCLVANRAFGYLVTHFWDPVQAGLYWSLSADSSLLDAKKQVYAQAFGIYAFSEYYRLSNSIKAKSLALELFDLLEMHAKDTLKGGYFEAFGRNWEEWMTFASVKRT